MTTYHITPIALKNRPSTPGSPIEVLHVCMKDREEIESNQDQEMKNQESNISEKWGRQKNYIRRESKTTDIQHGIHARDRDVQIDR